MDDEDQAFDWENGLEGMLQMRGGENCTQYVNFLDFYAPSVVGNTNWLNNRGIGDLNVLLTKTDEAFLLTVLIGYKDHWDDLIRDARKVS